ncbi:MAG: arginine decarboxylase, pyruvoyl-dependent [Balneolales bacterium]
MAETPTTYCLVKGTGDSNMELNAFDKALLDAGVGDTNLMRVSSIVPPGCKEIYEVTLPKGALIPIAYAEITSSVPGDVLSAAVAVGIPEDDEEPGVIMEHEATQPLGKTRDVVEQMVADAFEYRNRKLKEIKTVGIEHIVEVNGAAFAAAVLWYE